MSDPKLAEVIRVGIKMENEGRETYEQAASRSTNPFAKQMFASLASDEQRHADWFRRLGEDAGVASELLQGPAPEEFLQGVSSVFKQFRQQIEGKPADADDIKSIETALGLEEMSYKAYAEAAAEADDPDVKKLLGRVATEENNHYRILDDAKLYLTDPEKWNIQQEKPLIDGG